jgi:hypothetical protein
MNLNGVISTLVLHRKEKLEGYTKFAKEEAVPYWLSVPGMKEFRAYRKPKSLVH